jgi:hypothetical protein
MRTLIIVTTSAATLFSSAVFAQQPSQSTASIPDFSGFWSHPYWPGFELPLSGPGPVVNTSRRRRIFDDDGRPFPPANAPLVSDPFRLVGDYTNPILKPQAAQVVKRRGELELRGMPAPTPTNQCWPEPVPQIFWNLGMQMLQHPDRITIVYLADHQVRQVRMTQSHPATVVPSWHGDSVGRYEGGTLVIDTVGVKIGPFARVDMFGTPYSEALHVVERYRLLDYEALKEAQERAENENWRFNDIGPWAPDPNYKGKGLQLDFTVEDTRVFTMPWSATITYRRPITTEWPENVCAENPHDYTTGKDTRVPRADNPDF